MELIQEAVKAAAAFVTANPALAERALALVEKLAEHAIAQAPAKS